MEHYNDLYKNLLGAFASISVPAISRDTSARVLAVTYVHGNNEAFVYNVKYLTDIKHIQQMYHIDGGECPDNEIVELINRYVIELEDFRDEHLHDFNKSGAIFRSKVPEWAHRLFMERYNITLF